MSRNTEKAQGTLNRFQALKNRQAGVLESNPNLRPRYVQSVDSIPQAERWRTTVLSEISINLTRVQDEVLGDFQIRDINDKLNKLFREKRAWEHHIKSLGGADHINYGKDRFENSVVLHGHRYFGRARDLPDVKEILAAQQKQQLDMRDEKSAESTAKRVLRERKERVEVLYYGFYDEDAGTDVIDASEAHIAKELNMAVGREVISLSEYEGAEESDTDSIRNQGENSASPDEPSNLLQFEEMRGRELQVTEKRESEGFDLEALPSNAEVQKWLVERRKRQLLERLGVAR